MMRAKVGLVFSHRPKECATWPSKGYDYEKRVNELRCQLEKACPNINFFPVVVHSPDEVKEFLEEHEDLDGFVVYMVGIWTGCNPGEDFPVPFTSASVRYSVGLTVARTEKPTVFVDDLYAGSGEFLLSSAIAKKEGLPVVGVSSSNFKDVVETVKLFEVINRLKNSKIILVAKGKYELWIDTERAKQTLGTEILKLEPENLIRAYNSVSAEDAKALANKWSQEALKIVEPSEEEILRSAKLYLAMKALMTENDADAITIDCLGLFARGELPAYPCLGFFQLNNDGSAGVCEGDIDSALTQLMIRYISGRPGFVSDPVVDTATSQIIYAHCVAPNRVYGAEGFCNPYIIRSHAEDNAGAAIQSIMPLGKTVTTIKLNSLERAISLHEARTVANVQEEKGCRTKLAAETDVNKILENWNYEVNFGWHRVTCYGSLRSKIKDLAKLLGLKVIEEDG